MKKKSCCLLGKSVSIHCDSNIYLVGKVGTYRLTVTLHAHLVFDSQARCLAGRLFIGKAGHPASFECTNIAPSPARGPDVL